ncbi:hypothetical protein HX787_21360 [Pseudomonas tolaasii]|uniref:Alpha 1,4-glycosyltransferase domain-containing protein n=2 Tax=Pseudomonas tolaasii TaxID=29442 RepID=A0A7Y8AQC7_PSETO|nr:glycosyltransferase [Pseudomonas tolaasii]KAB0470599.1 hypothetical protein F7R12_20385 [Pseudomonas tolaasii]MBY8944037.1 hypothetical protein [Pseudomonas tolaasii]NVZ45404.1 hypothetical protein [Pseudomonas tolaasii]NWA48616.1 hypothetical protein [Pseudomonas tolaasii]NWC22394.1 hypothetical protein [Pseudomonas tolaasii]
MPPYIALALVSIQRALGEKFLLLTPRTTPDFIDASILGKEWGFEPLAFNLAEGIEAIIAKSDLIRMAFVHRHGGAWVDADSIFLRDPTSQLFPTGLSDKLHWFSECIFASRPGNALLAQALKAGLAGGVHAWGNPGGIKDIVGHQPGERVLISPSVVDPGYRPLYNFDSCDVMRRQDVAIADFLVADVAMLKLYNTYFNRTAHRVGSVADFLAEGSLMAKLFLHIEQAPEYWLSETSRLIEWCEQ